MIEHYTIKSKRQDNGLWGTPIFLKSIKGGLLTKDESKNQILSAVIMSFAENKMQNFSFELLTENAFLINADINYYYLFEHFGLIKNKLYFLPTDDDRKEFSRMLKLKKIINDRQQNS